MTDNTLLIAKVSRIPVDERLKLFGVDSVKPNIIARRELSLSVIGRLCDYFECQPWDLIQFKDRSDCRWYLELENKRYDKMRKLAVEKLGCVSRLCYKTGIDTSIVSSDYNISLALMCRAAEVLKVNISDLVEGEWNSV